MHTHFIALFTTMNVEINCCCCRIDSLQFANTMASIWHILSSTGWSQFMWNGMLDCHSIYDAVICHCINSMFPMAYEQRSWSDNVFALFRIRCDFADVRIRTFDVSILKCSDRKSKGKPFKQIHPHSTTTTTTRASKHFVFPTAHRIRCAREWNKYSREQPNQIKPKWMWKSVIFVMKCVKVWK